MAGKPWQTVSKNVSGYKGVYPCSKRDRWKAVLCVAAGKRKHLGTYDTPERAYAAYCDGARKILGREQP